MVRCASRSIVTESFERFTRQLHNFISKKKNQPFANRKIQEPSALKRKILAGTSDRITQERLTKDERASLFSA